MSTRVLPKSAALVSRGFAGRAERSSVEASTRRTAAHADSRKLDRHLSRRQRRRMGSQDPFNIFAGRFDDVSIKFGGGLEYGFAPNWSAKLEYRAAAAASFELSHLNETRAAGNCRFSGIETWFALRPLPLSLF